MQLIIGGDRHLDLGRLDKQIPENTAKNPYIHTKNCRLSIYASLYIPKIWVGLAVSSLNGRAANEINLY